MCILPLNQCHKSLQFNPFTAVHAVIASISHLALVVTSEKAHCKLATDISDIFLNNFLADMTSEEHSNDNGID